MKTRNNPLILIIASYMMLTSNAIHAADLSWDGAVNSNWNTTDANWSGSTWSNTSPDNAIFTNNTGTINLTEAITAGNVTFGLTNANTSGAFSGSALTINGNLTAQADNNNGSGVVTTSFSNNVSVGGDVVINRRVLEITGGTFTANRISSTNAWGRLLISGGAVTATNGVDDSVLGGGVAMNVFLQGGTLSTPYIKTTSATWTGLPEDGVVLNGGTLIATASSTDFIQTWDPGGWGVRNTVGVGPNGANIDTNGFDIAINRTLVNYGGSGTLTKNGAGKLTLNWSEHNGGTTVNGGTLEYVANSGYSLLRGPLTVNSGATVSVLGDGTGLGWQGGHIVTTLTINGGTVTSNGTMHIWNMSGGVNMTGGTLQSNGGVSDANGPQLEWINSTVTTNASADTATIGGRIRMRGDGGAAGITFNVADGAAATDLLVSAAITEAWDPGRSITKNGAGKMVLSGYNIYTGSTTVNEGTLELSGANSGYGNIRGSLTVNAGATVAITNGDGTGFGWNAPVSSIAVNGGTLNAVTGAHVGFGAFTSVSVSNGGTIAGNWQWNGDGALAFASSGNGTNTISGNLTLRADNGANHTFTVADGTAAVDLHISGNLSDQYPEVGWLPGSNLVKDGAGTMVISGSNTYDGSTIVSAGTLLVNGSLGNTAVIVNGGTIGGTGALAGSMTLSNGLFHVVNLSDALAVAGTISLYAGFGVDDLTGLDWGTVANGTYTLIDGALGSGVFDALANNSLATAYDIGSGRSAYYQQGSLQLVVIPESSSALLSGVGLLALLRRRRA